MSGQSPVILYRFRKTEYPGGRTTTVFEKMNRRVLGSVMAIAQGLITVIAPRMSARFRSRMIEQNYEDAEELEPKAAYLQQIRALGIGLAAAGIAGFAMEIAADSEESVAPISDDEAADSEESADLTSDDA